jgi:RNA polymerase subunit RPABC4/transcription elongation factor Spt4
MKQCPKCGKDHNMSGVFCSRSCANSRVFSDDAKLKKSVALKGKPSNKSEIADKDAWRKNISEKLLARSDSRQFEDCGWDTKRKRVIREQNYKCITCGLSEWLGKPISFEIDHKDGDNANDSRDNLEAMCPNCHSTTDTWRGRNKR